MSDELLLTVTEAARRLGIGRTLLYELMLRGEVMSVKVGRSRRVPVWSVEQFVKAKIAEAGGAELPFEALTL